MYPLRSFQFHTIDNSSIQKIQKKPEKRLIPFLKTIEYTSNLLFKEGVYPDFFKQIVKNKDSLGTALYEKIWRGSK